ncbi:MAG: hypothetical protein HC880_18525 [Bacteroidia bacterium]|nr:hypothetical protein [Bacteroidia bacterium]
MQTYSIRRVLIPVSFSNHISCPLLLWNNVPAAWPPREAVLWLDTLDEAPAKLYQMRDFTRSVGISVHFIYVETSTTHDQEAYKARLSALAEQT